MEPLFKIVSTCLGGGYRYCRTEPSHPKANANGLYPLHRVIVENREGRILDRDEVVHHADGDKGNDSADNLELLTRSEHAAHHAREHAPDMIHVVCPCGKGFEMKPSIYRRAVKDRKSKRPHCSRRCAGHYAQQARPASASTLP